MIAKLYTFDSKKYPKECEYWVDYAFKVLTQIKCFNRNRHFNETSSEEEYIAKTGESEESTPGESDEAVIVSFDE